VGCKKQNGAENSWHISIFRDDLSLSAYSTERELNKVSDLVDHFRYSCFLGLLASVTDGS